MIPWKDDGGVKVAGSPSTLADPCVMGSTPIVISPTAAHPSIGGADVAAFMAKPADGPASPADRVATVPYAMVMKLPARLRDRRRRRPARAEGRHPPEHRP